MHDPLQPSNSRGQVKKQLLSSFLSALTALFGALMLGFYWLENSFTGDISFKKQWVIDLIVIHYALFFLIIPSACFMFVEKWKHHASFALVLLLGLSSWSIMRRFVNPYYDIFSLVFIALFVLALASAVVHFGISLRQNPLRALNAAFLSSVILAIVLLFVHLCLTPERITSASQLSDGIHKRKGWDGAYSELFTKDGKYISITSWTSPEKNRLVSRLLFDTEGEVKWCKQYDTTGQLIRVSSNEYNFYEWYSNGQMKAKSIQRPGLHIRQHWYEDGRTKDSCVFEKDGTLKTTYHF